MGKENYNFQKKKKILKIPPEFIIYTHSLNKHSKGKRKSIKYVQMRKIVNLFDIIE